MNRKRFTSEQIITMLREAKVLAEAWQKAYNRIKLPSSLGYRPPAPEAHRGREIHSWAGTMLRGRSQ